MRVGSTGLPTFKAEYVLIYKVSSLDSPSPLPNAEQGLLARGAAAQPAPPQPGLTGAPASLFLLPMASQPLSGLVLLIEAKASRPGLSVTLSALFCAQPFLFTRSCFSVRQGPVLASEMSSPARVGMTSPRARSYTHVLCVMCSRITALRGDENKTLGSFMPASQPEHRLENLTQIKAATETERVTATGRQGVE